MYNGKEIITKSGEKINLVGKSKREILSIIKGMDIEMITYFESKHGIPKEMRIIFKTSKNHYGQKYFYLSFDKNTRRVTDHGIYSYDNIEKPINFKRI